MAFSAVQAVWGEDDPLLQSRYTLPGAGDSLRDEVYRDDHERTIYSGDARDTILGALWLTAAEDSTSVHRLKARQILARLAISEAAVAPDQTDATLLVGEKGDVPAPVPHTDESSFSTAELLEQQTIVLRSFEHVIAAYRTVHEFVGSDHDILQRNYGEDGRYSLADVLYTTDPFKVNPWIFKGYNALVIRHALTKAAARDESYTDKSAGLTLKAQRETPRPAAAPIAPLGFEVKALAA